MGSGPLWERPGPSNPFIDRAIYSDMASTAENIEHDRLPAASLAKRDDVFYILAEFAPSMLWITDNEGTPIHFNRRWLEYTGLPMEQGLDGGWLDCVHPDDREPFFESVLGPRARRERLEGRYRLRRHDGEYLPMYVFAEPYRDEDGNFVGYVGCTVDISKQEASETKLRATNAVLAKHSKDIELLNELNDNLQVCQNVDETKSILKRFGRKLFPDAAVTVSLYNESRNLVEPFVSWGHHADYEDMIAPEQCWALRKSKPHCELGEDDVVCPNFASCPDRRYVCLPMLAYGEVMGNLHLDLRASATTGGEAENSELIDKLLQLANVAADQIALALANLKLRATLQFQSTRDSLTQLYNRRYIQDALERELARATRSEKPLAVMMMDIDHFKRYNDTYGHDAGDHVLREFGALLRNAIRGSDIASRYGGEEFLALLPETDAESAGLRAEQIRRQVSGLGLEFRGEQLGQITVSIGIAAFPDAATSVDELITHSDMALYRAKANGRNCVELAPSEIRSS